MINSLLEYEFISIEVDKYLERQKQIKAIDFNSFDHDNYKKDTHDFESVKGKNYYGKKRRYYTDYC
jgi:hypothetical protein